MLNKTPQELLDTALPLAPARVTTRIVQIPFDLTWPEVRIIPEELHGPPRMNEAFLWLNRLMGCTIHALELAEVSAPRVKIIFHISRSGLFKGTMTFGAAYGAPPTRISDEAVLVVNAIHATHLPKASFTIRRCT